MMSEKACSSFSSIVSASFFGLVSFSFLFSASSLFLMRENGKQCLLWLDDIGEEGESDK